MRVSPSSSLADLLKPVGRHVWRGKSHRAFTLVAYSLIGCPAPAAACWVLVRRNPDGLRVALATGRTRSSAPTLNLAHIRHQGASLGADEVHLLGPGDDDPGFAMAASDIALAEGVPEIAVPDES